MPQRSGGKGEKLALSMAAIVSGIAFLNSFVFATDIALTFGVSPSETFCPFGSHLSRATIQTPVNP
jgi:hypothetical protein